MLNRIEDRIATLALILWCSAESARRQLEKVCVFSNVLQDEARVWPPDELYTFYR